MKEIRLLLIILSLLLGFSSLVQAAPVLQVGDIAFKLNDVTFFDVPPNLLQPGQPAPSTPSWAGSGRTWGIANVTTIHRLLPGTTVENPILDPIPIWSATTTDLLQVRFGGLIMMHTSPGAPAYPWNAYFGKDSNSAYLSPAGNAYIEVYSRTSDGYGVDVVAGPGNGTYNSFGKNIALGGTLWLDLKAQDGLLPHFDPLALPGDVEITTLNSLLTGASTVYATIVGGSTATSFGNRIFPIDNPTFTPRADIKLRVNLTSFYNQTTNKWDNPFGWTNDSNDPVTGTIVERKPCVKIIKKTNGADANDPNGADVPMIAAGGQVTWDYEITNCGNVHVAKADVTVNDSQTGVTPAFASVVSGNNDDVLDPGEIWLYKATGSALDLLLPQPGATTVPNVCTHSGQLPPRTAYTNIGRVTIPGATASDPSSYCNPPAPCVNIIKYTNGADANDTNGTDVPDIGTGLSVTWTYKVTNCGNVSVAKADVKVADDQGVIPVYVSGDVNNNGLFDPGEIWLYQATGVALNLLAPPAGVHVQPGVCTHAQTEPPRTAYINLGTVTIPGASATDPSSYCNPPGPCVTIIKKTNGKDANDPNGAGVPILLTGALVTWTYEITNCGNVSVASADVRVSDNQPGVTPSYTSGDANNNGMFDPGETWLYTASGTALDLTNPPAGIHVRPGVCTQGGTVQFPSTAYVNTGTVTIPGASASDPSSYCNPPPVPCVKIVKKTNGADANNPDGADVPLVSAGDPVTWTYEVTNCGSLSVPIAQVIVTDDQGVTPVFDKVLSGNSDSYFDPGEVWLYKATGTALDLSSPPPFIKVQQGVCTHDHTQPPRTAYINIGTVTIPGATASDPSSYCNPQKPFGGCRMTGGNVTVDNAIVCNPWSVSNSKATTPKNANQFYTSYTVGGQIGAPKAGCADTAGAAFGEWTHTQHSGAEGSFTFHAGTNSAPDDAFIKCITCADPGWCTQARCAPFKQIFFEGTGVFKNERGFDFKVPATCSTGVIPYSDKKHTLHYFKSHVGDFGEPGNSGKQKSFDPNVCKWRSGGVDLANLVTLPSVPDPKFGDKGGQACDTCPDWYEIEIHCTADPSSPVIYRGAGFITGGNYQIHPEVGQQCPF